MAASTAIEGELTEQERRVAEILAANPTAGNAAVGRIVGVTEETVCRMRHREHVAAMIQRLTGEQPAEWREELRAAARIGLSTLIELARSSRRESVRLGAAKQLADLAAQLPPETSATAGVLDEVTMVTRFRRALVGSADPGASAHDATAQASRVIEATAVEGGAT